MQKPSQKRNCGNKPGIFNNAVFSKIVSAADHPSVREGVNRDLKTILKKPEQNNSRRWNHAPQTDSRDSARFDVKRIRQPGRGLSFLKPNKDEMTVRRVPRDYDEIQPSPSPIQRPRLDLFSNFNNIVSEAQIDQIPKKKPKVSKVKFDPRDKTFEFRGEENYNFNDDVIPERFETFGNEGSPEGRGFSLFDSQPLMPMRPEIPKPKIVPAQLPIEEIISQTSEALPKLTLRNGHPLTYSSLVSDLCRKSLLRQQKGGSSIGSDKEDMTPANVMNQLNMTIHQAARENTELLNQLKGNEPLRVSYESESPIAAQITQNQFPLDINSPYRTPTNSQESPLYSVSFEDQTPGTSTQYETPPFQDEEKTPPFQEKLSGQESFGLSLIYNAPSQFAFDSPEFFD